VVARGFRAGDTPERGCPDTAACPESRGARRKDPPSGGKGSRPRRRTRLPGSATPSRWRPAPPPSVTVATLPPPSQETLGAHAGDDGAIDVGSLVGEDGEPVADDSFDWILEAPTPEQCDQALADYRARGLDSLPLNAPITAGGAESLGDSVLFFLHVPRTAGRSAGSCLLRPAFAPSRRCQKSYDKLRLRSDDDCDYVSSHDDLSALYDALLEEDAAAFSRPLSVLSVIRDPVERFLSSYEMGLDTAAAVLARPAHLRERPTAGSVPRRGGKAGPRQSVKEIWPWSYIMPYFVDQVTLRHLSDPDLGDALTALNEAGEYNPFDSPAYPSARAFAESPIAADLVHNGQVHQLLGTTEQSTFAEAPTLRACSVHSRPHAEELLGMAIQRLRGLLSVGVFEDRLQSWRAFSYAMNVEPGAPGYLTMPVGTKYDYNDDEESVVVHMMEDAELVQPVPFLETVELCSSGMHNRDAIKRVTSISEVMRNYFGTENTFPFPTKNLRKLNIPGEHLERVRELNWMDAALHAEARKLLDAQVSDMDAAGFPEIPVLEGEALERVKRSMEDAMRAAKARGMEIAAVEEGMTLEEFQEMHRSKEALRGRGQMRLGGRHEEL